MTAAESAASRQCAVPWRTTPRNDLSVSPPFSWLYGRSFSQSWTAAGVRSRAITRRSAAVNGRRGGTTGSVRGSGRRFEVGNEIGRRPVVAGMDFHHPSFGVDDGGSEVVREVCATAEILFRKDPELAGESARRLRLSGHKTPDRRVGVETRGVAAEHGRGVELRVERHGDETDVAHVGRALNALLHGREVSIHQRAEVRERAARERERDRDAVAFEAGEGRAFSC